jgi:hypothetical protein
MIGQTVTQAQAEYETKYARRKAVEEAPPAVPAEAAPVVAAEIAAAPAESAAPPA